MTPGRTTSPEPPASAKVTSNGTIGERIASMIIARHRVVLATALFFAVGGLVAWLGMPREEDPRMPNRFGLVVTPFPGADAETIERLVIDPIEEHLSEVAEVALVTATARANVALVSIELQDVISDLEPAWKRVEDALDDARDELPDGVGPYALDKRLIGDQEAVVLAITGSVDPIALRDGAERVKRALEPLTGVAEVRVVADPGEQITIEYDALHARSLGISPMSLANQLAARNQVVPAGSLRVGDRSVALDSGSELDSFADLERSALALPSGASIALGDIATVRHGPEEPVVEIMRVGGERGVALSVIPEPGIDVVALGRRIRGELAQLAQPLAPLQIEELSFQPDYVSQRLDGLSRSLLIGIGIVAGILVIFMGLRLGLLVVAVVPLVALSSLAIYAFHGGVLHQLSVAALILALGLLVDNAIVIAESAQQRLDQGLDRRSAAIQAIRELAFPLATATGTTIAAFVPMYVSEGPTGDFTRAIPAVAMLTLTVSYLFAVTVTPVLAALLLKPRGLHTERSFRRVTSWLSRVAPGHPKKVVLGALLAVLASASGARHLELEFFPGADRDQFVVEVVLAEGSHIAETSQASRLVERAMLAHPAVTEVSAFVGRSAPRFFYNVPNRPNSPHFANLVIETEKRGDIAAVIEHLREVARDRLPFVEIIARRLAQGPPLDAPVEIRVSGHGDVDLGALHRAAERVMAEIRAIPGAINVRHDLGIGRPTLRFDVEDAAAARHGLTRVDVARAVLEQTRGLEVGQLRAGDDPIAIRVRGAEGEDFDVDRLSSIEISTGDGRLVPVAQVARVEVEWRPAAVHRRDQDRVVTIAAQLADGVTYSQIVSQLEPRLAELDLGSGIDWEHGGAVEGSGDANQALGKAAPIGAILLLFFVLIEFNSFRRLIIILSTVPLAATGIVPGLLLGDQPFGFMSMLGVFALIGVVVNNAIVLLSVVDARREQGAPVADALAAAVKLRTRPILLTTATTVAGLIPLAISESQLWPPMAFAMIAGLLASTALTLLVVPALYALLFRDRVNPSHAMGQLGEGS